jgi:tetratricopeptide (TPR) repeat protein
MSEIEIWNELGSLFFNTGSYDQAIQAYQKAIELDQCCGQSYSNLATIYIQQERYAEAVPLLEKGIDLYEEGKKKAILWNRLGEAYLHLDDYDNALAAYHTALVLDPENTAIRDNLAKAEMNASQVETEEGEKEALLTEESAADIFTQEEAEKMPAEDKLEPTAESTSRPEADGENADPEAACWVFNANEPATPAKTPGSDAEPSPVILGSRILSETPIEPETAETPNQAPADRTAEESDLFPAVTANPDNTDPVAGPQAISVIVKDDGIDPDQSTTLAEEPTTEQSPTEPVAGASEPTVAEIAVAPSSPDLEAGEPINGNEPTSPTSQSIETAEVTSEQAEVLLQIGIRYWRKGDLEKASRFLENALDTASDHFDTRTAAFSYHAIAMVETDLGKIDEAIQAYEKAVSLAPGEIFPWNYLGRLYNQLDQHDKAMTTFQKAIEHNPKDAISWNGLGDVYHKLGRNDDAIAAYQLGNVFDLQGREEDATAKYEMAFNDEQKNPDPWKEMGNVYFNSGEHVEAIRAYQKALELTDEAAAKALEWDRLGDIYQRLDDHENAIAAYLKAVELDPENALFRESYIKAGGDPAVITPEDTAEEPEHTLEPETNQENPPSPEENLEEQVVTVEESDPIEQELVNPEPEEVSDPIPETVPDLPDAVENTEAEPAYWVFETNPAAVKTTQPSEQYNEAVADAPVAPHKSPSTLPLSQFNGEVILDKHVRTEVPQKAAVMVIEPEPEVDIEQEPSENVIPKTDDAVASNLRIPVPGVSIASPEQTDFHVLENDIAAYRRVTEINPKNDRAWDALGNMYEAIGLHSEAIASFEEAISLAPQREVYYYHLGLAHASQTHYDTAILALKKVVELNPDYMLAHCALAGYYRRVGKDAEAQKHIAIARPCIENENEYNHACFESISGDADRAIAFLKIALEKQQIQLDWVRSDPDLDFIRTDPRFEALVRKTASVLQ